jgi:hypothetical protein
MTVNKQRLVYFIQRGTDGPIKIGSTLNLEGRLVQLQSSNAEKLHVLATSQGGRRLERELHKRFAKNRLVGEWFSAHEELFRFISLELPTLSVEIEKKGRYDELLDDAAFGKVKNAVERAEGNITVAAELLGLSRSHTSKLVAWSGLNELARQLRIASGAPARGRPPTWGRSPSKK